MKSIKSGLRQPKVPSVCLNLSSLRVHRDIDVISVIAVHVTAKAIVAFVAKAHHASDELMQLSITHEMENHRDVYNVARSLESVIL